MTLDQITNGLIKQAALARRYYNQNQIKKAQANVKRARTLLHNAEKILQWATRENETAQQAAREGKI